MSRSVKTEVHWGPIKGNLKIMCILDRADDLMWEVHDDGPVAGSPICSRSTPIGMS